MILRALQHELGVHSKHLSLAPGLFKLEQKLKNNYMKQLGLLFGLMIGSMAMYAQKANLVIFSDEGTKFYLVVNGLRVNDQSLTNVRLTDLNADYVKAKIVFEDPLIPDIEKNTLMLVRGHEVTYNVKKNKKGQMVCNAYSDVELSQIPAQSANQQTIVYTNVPPNDGIVIRTGNMGGTTTTTTTTTTTGTTGTGTTDVISTNVGVGGVGMNVTIVDGTGGTVNGSTTSTTTTTYSSTSTTSTGNGGTTTTYMNNDCIYGMSETDFRAAKNSISSATFEDTKTSTFKQVVSSKCVTTKQVKEMLQLFTFEETKLELAKYAYTYVSDPSNYYTINDIFTFDMSKDELSNYVMSNKRN